MRINFNSLLNLIYDSSAAAALKKHQVKSLAQLKKEREALAAQLQGEHV